MGDTYHRDSPGNFAAGPYVNRTGRNDIVESKVARDDRFVYFYVRTAEPLTPYTDPLWMLLFIDADGDHSTGWEGYDLLVNESLQRRSPYERESLWTRRLGKTCDDRLSL